MKLLKYIPLFLLTIIGSLQAQEELSVEEVFDDKVYHAKTIIEVSPSLMIAGDASIFISRPIYKGFHLKLGVGRVFSYATLKEVFDHDVYENVNYPGKSYTLSALQNVEIVGMKYWYGVNSRLRLYPTDAGDNRLLQVALTGGYNISERGRIRQSISFNAGLSWTKLASDGYWEPYSIAPLVIYRVGFMI